jgi:hypothetical protein
MAQPFNYTLNVPNPAEAVTSGLQQGVNLASIMERTDALAAQKQQTLIENQALRAKAQRAQDFQGELGKLAAEGFTARGLNELMIRYPEAAKQLEAQYTNLGTQERQARVDALLPVAAAVNAGDSVSAQLVLRDQIEALTNSGKTDEAKAASRMLDLITTNPAAAKSTLNLATAGAMGMDKYADTLVKFEGSRREEELQPAKIAKAVAEGKTATIVADTEQKMRDAEIALKGAQTTSAKASAGASYASAKKTLREIQRIDALEPGEVRKLAAEAGKLEAEAAVKRGEGGAQNAIAAGQRVLDTVALLRGPKGDFGVLKDIAGPITSKTPTFKEASADAERAIETVQSQVFLSQVNQMKGLGALTEKEGDRLVASIANLSLNQSPDRLQRNLLYIEDTMKTAMEKARAIESASKPAAPAKTSTITLPGGFTYTPEGE